VSAAGKWRRRRVPGLVLVAIAILLVAATGAGNALIRTRPLTQPDAILVLASREWERIPEAADRARQTPSASLLLSVPRVVTEQNCHRCAERDEWLEALGVDAERVVFLPQRVGNTRDEARSALAFCRQQGIRRLLVVTSPYHTRRALATFDHVFDRSGVQVGVEPATAHSPARPGRWWATPYDRWYVRYEWSAIAFYAVRYGIIPAS